MEKLIELLNEYKKLGEYKEYWYNWKQVKLIEYSEDYAEISSEDVTEKIISKRYWFIKWLINNHYIELPMWLWVIRSYNKDEWCYEWYDDYRSMLMLLSIQDNPIEFLISILK